MPGPSDSTTTVSRSIYVANRPTGRRHFRDRTRDVRHVFGTHAASLNVAVLVRGGGDSEEIRARVWRAANNVTKPNGPVHVHVFECSKRTVVFKTQHGDARPSTVRPGRVEFGYFADGSWYDGNGHRIRISLYRVVLVTCPANGRPYYLVARDCRTYGRRSGTNARLCFRVSPRVIVGRRKKTIIIITKHTRRGVRVYAIIRLLTISKNYIPIRVPGIQRRTAIKMFGAQTIYARTHELEKKNNIN